MASKSLHDARADAAPAPLPYARAASREGFLARLTQFADGVGLSEPERQRRQLDELRADVHRLMAALGEQARRIERLEARGDRGGRGE